MSDEINQSLLPPNASILLRDLEEIFGKSFDLPVLNRFVVNPNLAPAHILPWLAWALSVDDWSDSWPEQIRRNVIKASVEVHKKKGTIGALKKALQAFNYTNIKVEEWFEYGADPYFFRVFFDVREPGFDVNILPQVQKVIENTKNARSHLESLRAYLSAEMGLVSIGSIVISKEVTPIPYIIYDTDDELKNTSSTPHIGAFLISKEITQINPIIFNSDDHIAVENAAMPTVGTFLISKEITTINPLI
ncbi:MAG: phage tail protein I [Proteobacteria bacterium]|nr:phage tail protein I [Pseudomonadota bacterium]